MEKFPDDILPSIFVRLPAKQLAQMRRLSKYWNTLLSESSFIKSHLKRSIQNNNNDGVLLVFKRSFSFASKPFTPHPYRSPYLDHTDFIKLPVNNNPHSNDHNKSRGKLIGSVNGLICFRYRYNRNSKVSWGPDSKVFYGLNHGSQVIYIWYPSLSALLTLPPYYIPSHPVQQFFRFGFDPKTDDYKVVRITRRLLTSRVTIDDYKEWLPVEIYSMRKGSWKLTTQTIPSHISDISVSDDLFVNGHDGHLHWLHGQVNKRKTDSKTILAFDLGEETFSEIPLPVSVIDDNVNEGVGITLGVFAGKLCVISRVDLDSECVVWVMEEYGVAESWVLRHVFPPFSGYVYPYGFTSHNEFLFRFARRGHGLHDDLYDLVAANTKILHFGNCAGVKVVDYVDSLVWVTPEQCKMICCSISQVQF